ESINPKFQVEVLGVQWPTYLKATREMLCPLYIVGWVADYPDSHNFFSTYYHSKGYYGARHGEDYAAFAVKYLDPIIDAAVIESNVSKRAELYAQLQKILLDNYIAAPLYMPQGLFVARKWLKGFFPHLIRSSGDSTPEFYYAWKE
ncbi:MAG TPA: ABC transporter substrate-binding protein, partial [Thermotogota bacterium]|nr:ABC transporter substrate-binding protein [Thermotogota bacterium]